jgi:hypothetical protein
VDKQEAFNDALQALDTLGVPKAAHGLFLTAFADRLKALGEQRFRALIGRIVDDLVVYYRGGDQSEVSEK